MISVPPYSSFTVFFTVEKLMSECQFQSFVLIIVPPTVNSKPEFLIFPILS